MLQPVLFVLMLSDRRVFILRPLAQTWDHRGEKMDSRKGGTLAAAYPSKQDFLFSMISKQPMWGKLCPSGERMTKRNIPPGRRSISHSVVTQGAGVTMLLHMGRLCPSQPHQFRRNIYRAL